MKDFVRSLKERKLVQWALAYLAGAWLLMQVVEVLAARWPLPLGLQRGIDLLLVVGFGLALVLAWYHGEQGHQRVSGPELVMIAILCTMAASVLAILRADGRPGAAGGGAVARVAVLPFENFSPDPGLAYFAGGLHDRVITQLSTISALSVLPRSSVMQYETRPVPSSQIAEELGVSAVVLGSVRREGDWLNLSVTLIEATSDRQLWSQEFDQQYTAEAAIRAEREIAERVADALGARMAPGERAVLDETPTTNSEAYDAYLRAVDFEQRFDQLSEDLTRVERFREVVALDPDFAPAWAGLSRQYLRAEPYGADSARVAAETAVRLQPSLAEAHLALGSSIQDDAFARMTAYRRALELNPNNPRILWFVGTWAGERGQWDDAMDLFERAVENDPTYWTPIRGLGLMYQRVGRFEDAERMFERAISVNPGLANPRRNLAMLYPRWTGDTGPSRRVLEAATGVQRAEDLFYTWVQLDILDRKYEDALRRIADEPGVFAPGFPTSERRTPVVQLAAEVYRLTGDAARARALYDSASVVLERAVLSAPGSVALHRNLGRVYAVLGQREKALYHGRLALSLMTPEENHLYGPDNLVNMAAIHAHLGDAHEAMSYLDRVLSAPSLLTVRLLELHPTWDPLRSSPAFVELLEKHGSASAGPDSVKTDGS
jgi:TolB-like protein/Tfp pilus assembly protein PilF